MADIFNKDDDPCILIQAGTSRFVVNITALSAVSKVFKQHIESENFLYCDDACYTGSSYSVLRRNDTYILNVDGDMFKHIINFANTKQYPLFYQGRSGFDYGRYVALEQLARKLEVEDLVHWIHTKGYEDAVHITRFDKDHRNSAIDEDSGFELVKSGGRGVSRVGNSVEIQYNKLKV